MKTYSTRKSWDTAVKHLVRHGILGDVLLPSQIDLIPSSNISRWKNEADDKYQYCEINKIGKPIAKNAITIKEFLFVIKVREKFPSYFSKFILKCPLSNYFC